MNSYRQIDDGSWRPSGECADLHNPSVLGWQLCLASTKYYAGSSDESWSDAMFDGTSHYTAKRFNKMCSRLREIMEHPIAMRATGQHMVVDGDDLKVAEMVDFLWQGGTEKFRRAAIELAENPERIHEL